LPNSDGNSSSSSSKSNSHAIGLRRSIYSEPGHPSLGMIRPGIFKLGSALAHIDSFPWRACPSSSTLYKRVCTIDSESEVFLLTSYSRDDEKLVEACGNQEKRSNETSINMVPSPNYLPWN
jgi:hypothetical protein